MRQEKTGFWRKLLKSVTLKEEFTTQAQILVAEFSWSEKEIQRFPPWLARRLYLKGRRFLARKGCAGIAPDDRCAAAFSLQLEGESGLIVPIPPEKMTECVSFLLAKAGSGAPGHVYVRCRNLAALEQRMLDILCPRVKFLTFCTADGELASEFADRLCEEFGLYPDIRELGHDAPSRAMLIDLDARVIRMGNETGADGMEITLDLQGYCVNQNVFGDDLSLPVEQMDFVSWTRGKKRLTRP